MDRVSLISNELLALGINPRYKGYKQTIWTVRIVLEDERRLEKISQEIYRPIAKMMYCTYPSVERNVRTVAHRAWELNRPYLEELAGHPLPEPPMASVFLQILASRIRRIEEANPPEILLEGSEQILDI